MKIQWLAAVACSFEAKKEAFLFVLRKKIPLFCDRSKMVR